MFLKSKDSHLHIAVFDSVMAQNGLKWPEMTEK
jgi:hypothetical protein